MKQRELVSFHVGQAGVQIGNAVWELLCAEHGISESGEPNNNFQSDNNNDTFFRQSARDKYVPRSIFVDLEPTVIDEIRNGSYRTLFHPEKMISGPEDASNNFARGFFTVGKLILFQVESQIRKLFECTECVQAVLIYRSLGGGTGAGLTSAMFECLSDYPKTLKIELPIYPAPRTSSSTVEPYNCLLGEHFCMEDIGLGILIDNESLFEITSQFLHNREPSYSSINRLIGHIISNLTASIRFECICSSDVTVVQNNLVPYPRIHYPVCNIAPLLAYDSGPFEALTAKSMTEMLFQAGNQLIKIDQASGKYMSCVLFYRGNINICDVYDALFSIKRSKYIHFVDWCPTGFKVGINLNPPTFVPDCQMSPSDKNVVMLTNTSSIGEAWQRLTHKFYLLYSKRSFVHWFVGEGMEECEFTEALYNISSLVKDYEEIVTPTDMSHHMPVSRPVGTTNNTTATGAEDPHENVSLYVTMANGQVVSAADRSSLTAKTSLIKSSMMKAPSETVPVSRNELGMVAEETQSIGSPPKESHPNLVSEPQSKIEAHAEQTVQPFSEDHSEKDNHQLDTSSTNDPKVGVTNNETIEQLVMDQFTEDSGVQSVTYQGQEDQLKVETDDMVYVNEDDDTNMNNVCCNHCGTSDIILRQLRRLSLIKRN